MVSVVNDLLIHAGFFSYSFLSTVDIFAGNMPIVNNNWPILD